MSITVESEEVAAIFDAVNVKQPTQAALTTYRAWLATKPERWKLTGDMVAHAEGKMLATIGGTPLIVEGVKAGLAAQRGELGYATASPLERLLIDQIVVCWLQWYQAQLGYTDAMAEGSTLARGAYWERRLTIVQGRYLRAIDTLARVRRLAIPVQVNIATNGGQQVNQVNTTTLHE